MPSTTRKNYDAPCLHILWSTLVLYDKYSNLKRHSSFTSWIVKNLILFFYVHDLYNDLTHPLFFTCHFYDKQIALFYDVTMEKFFLVLTQNYSSISRTWQSSWTHTMEANARLELLLTSFLNCAKSDWKYVAVMDLLILWIKVDL